jgi:hypothetical protein
VYPVSSGFKTEMKAISRKVYGKVQVSYTDPFLDQSIIVTTNGQANTSYPEQTANSITKPFGKINSLDGSWILGQDFVLAPSPSEKDNYEMGWWGSELSDLNGEFDIPYPMITVTFSSRPITQLKVVGDSIRGEYPVDFFIRLYSGDTMKHTEMVDDNTLVNWEKTIPAVTDVDRMVLQIAQWSRPNSQVKILEYFTAIQETYEGEDILEISLTEERELSSGSLPIGNISSNQLTIKLNNQSRRFDANNSNSSLYRLIKANRRMYAWLGAEVNGVIEYVPLGEFWSGDWDVPEYDIYAKTTGLDRMELLRQSIYNKSQVQQNASLYDLAVGVLTDAGLSSSSYWIDTELQTITVPYAYFNSVSHREALRLIVEAALGYAYMDRNGILRIEGPSYLLGKTTALTIDEELYFTKSSPTKNDEIATFVEVETQPLKPATPEQVYQSNDPIAINSGATVTVTVSYNKTPCMNASASISGGTNVVITGSEFYAWGAIVSIKNNNASVQNVTLSITATPLEVINKEKATYQDDGSIKELGILKYQFPSNPLVQTLSRAKTIASTLLNSFKIARRNVEIQWRGNPAVLLSDRVTITDKTSSTDYYVTRQEITYAGYLRTKLNGRRVT